MTLVTHRYVHKIRHVYKHSTNSRLIEKDFVEAIKLFVQVLRNALYE